MSKKHVLNVKSREGKGNGPARRCRRSGMIPAIIYGHGKPGRAIEVCAKEFRPLTHKSIHLIDLIDEAGVTTLALLKNVQFDFLKDCTVHLDFQAVNLDEKITAKVVIHSTGTPVGISAGGLFEQSLHEVVISCTAGTLPDAITFDVENLAVGQVIHVSELPLPDGATVVTEGDTVVFTVAEPAVEEAAPVVEAPVDAKDAKAPVKAAASAPAKAKK